LYITAQEIEHHIDLAHFFLKTGAVIIDHRFRAQVPHEVGVAGRGRADDPGPLPSGQLHRKMPHPAGRGMDEHGLTGFETRHLK